MIWNLKESSVKKIILKIVFAVAAVAIVPMSAAVNAQEPSAEDLAKAAQNPIASMISVLVKGLIGRDRRTGPTGRVYP